MMCAEIFDLEASDFLDFLKFLKFLRKIGRAMAFHRPTYFAQKFQKIQKTCISHAVSLAARQDCYIFVWIFWAVCPFFRVNG